jgi:hypothetical protein
VVFADGRALVECSDLMCERCHEKSRESSFSGHVVEKIRLTKASHLDDGVHKRTGPVKAQRPIIISRDRMNAEIELRCGSSIELKLGLAAGETLFGSRKIEIWITDGSLQLKGAIPSHKDQRYVGRHEFDSRRAAAQELDCFSLITNHHGDLINGRSPATMIPRAAF